MNKRIVCGLLTGLASLSLLPTAALADTRVYVGVGLPYPPAVVIESPRHRHYPPPRYYAEPVVYYSPAPRYYDYDRGWDQGWDRHEHGRHCRHDDDRGNWRGRDDDRGYWRGNDDHRHGGHRR